MKSLATNRPGAGGCALGAACSWVMLLAWLMTLAPTPALAQAKLDPPSGKIDPADGPRLGTELVARLVQQVPATNRTNHGTLKIEGSGGMLRSVPVEFVIAAMGSNWFSSYETRSAEGAGTPVKVTVSHTPGQPNAYEVSEPGKPVRKLAGADTMIPFVGSDFWIADLGLEFLQWPGQKLIRRQLRKGQSCEVLESILPKPAPGGYRRVVSWLDIDTGGIVHATAYDADDRQLKEFEPKQFRKVKGEWQLEEMEIRNLQKGTKTRIEFKLGD